MRWGCVFMGMNDVLMLIEDVVVVGVNDVLLLVLFELLCKVWCVMFCMFDFCVVEQLVFVLYSYLYWEMSLIVDVLICDYGWFVFVVKGVKCLYFVLCGVLQMFQLLLLFWFGKFEVCMLMGVEWVGGMLLFGGDGLLCGFYVNELFVKFCVCEDLQLLLFNYYVLIFMCFVYGEFVVQVLCLFECVLLCEIGYVMVLNCMVVCCVVEFECCYVFDLECGVCNVDDDVLLYWLVIIGQMLFDMEQDDYY